jgi:hypothetical protein
MRISFVVLFLMLIFGLAFAVPAEPTVLFSGVKKRNNLVSELLQASSMMDQQMNVVANHPAMSGVGGLEWWTSLQADEETVRFVGKLYRHYAIEGKTEMLTKDPLFLTHIRNADFEKGIEG